MYASRFIWPMLVIGLAVLLSLPGEGIPLESKPPAALTSIENMVMVRKTGADTFEPAVVNMELYVGDRVRTGPNSFATLTYSNPEISKVKLYENTEIEVAELSPDARGLLQKASVTLTKGGAWAKIKNEAGRRDFKFELKTPNTVAAITGTSLAAIVYGPKETYYCACDGFIDITAADHPAIKIKAGEGTRVLAGAPPTMPINDSYIIKDPRYEKDPRYGWCIHCHNKIKENMAREQSGGCTRTRGSGPRKKPSSGGC